MKKRKVWKLVRRDVKMIKKDLKYHIKRTDILEKTVTSVWYRGALALAFLGGVFGAAKSFLLLFAN